MFPSKNFFFTCLFSGLPCQQNRFPIFGTYSLIAVMKKLLLCFLLLFPLFLIGQTTEEKALAVIEQFKASKGDEVYASMTKESRQQLSASQLKNLWAGLESQFGTYSHLEEPQSGNVGDQNYFKAFLVFQKSKLEFNIVYDKKGKIAGLLLKPVYDTPWKYPSYADSTRFTETETSFPSGNLTLTGTLTMPLTDQLHAVVILVHGSGPNDRDESFGPNRIFKDIAWGLASKGIAVFRYEKRTRAYRKDTAVMAAVKTPKEEVVDDAVAAAAFLKNYSGIDPEKIFIAGHSLGGMMAPEIARQSGEIKGVILLAAPARKLQDLVLEQYKYLLDTLAQAKDKASNAKYIQKLEKQNKTLASGKVTLKTAKDNLPLSLDASYWLYLQAYDQVATAKSLNLPFLVIQGKRDYQVRMADYQLWYQAFFPEGDFLLTDGNHFLIDGPGTVSTPAEYGNPGNVSEQIISKMVEFIRK